MAGKMLTTVLVIVTTGMSFASVAAEVSFERERVREVVSELQPQMERITRERVIADFGEAGDLGERLLDAAQEPVEGTPAQLASLVRQDFEKYGRLTRELRIRGE